MIIPTSAVKTASAITRGFASVTKSVRRAANRDPEGDCRSDTGIAVVFMANSLSANTCLKKSTRGGFGEAQFHNLESRGLLRVGGAGRAYGFLRCTLA